jgi:hypothetical protein
VQICAESWLLSGAGSVLAPLTVAVLLIAVGPHDPAGAVTLAVTRICVDPLAVSAPSLQDTVLLAVAHVPWAGCADTRLSPAAIGSLTFTLGSSLGPWLRTTSVYITCPPDDTVADEGPW